MDNLNHEQAFKEFLEYKVRVPVCGAIILSPECDQVLLVRGWKVNGSWSWPRGKINKNESEMDCALREVEEEIGFNGRNYIKETDYIERTMKEQRVRLYLFRGVPLDTVFETQTRKEIGDIKWFKLNDLPGYNEKSMPMEKSPSKFYMVTAFFNQ